MILFEDTMEFGELELLANSGDVQAQQVSWSETYMIGSYSISNTQINQIVFYLPDRCCLAVEE